MLRQTLFVVTIFFGCLAGIPTWAAGSSSISTPAPAQSPEEQAIRSLKQGIRQRDRALQYERKAAEAASDKRRDRAHKRALKAWQNAIAKQRDALRFDPRNYRAANELGYALRKTGAFENAIGSYNYALEINPDFHQAIEYRAEALLALGRFKAVRESYMVLFRNARPLADQLMVAMNQWLLDRQDVELSEAEAAFASWVASRQELAAVTQTLSHDPNPTW